MDRVVWLFFESLPALAAVLVTALFVLLVYWRRSGHVRPLLIGLAVALVLLIVQALVVTKRERAGRILDAIVADLIKSRTGALAAALAPDFRSAGRNRDEFIAYVAERLQTTQVRWADRTRLVIEAPESDRFVARANYVAQATSGGFAVTLPSEWTFTFVRTPQGWKIHDIECVRIEGLSESEWPLRRR